MSNGSVVELKNPNLPSSQISESELIKVLQSSLYPGASQESVKLVLGYCRAAGYDPLQKPVHIVPMWDSKAGAMRDVIMPGVGLYRTQAARTGQFAGMTEPEFGPDVTEAIGGESVTYPQWCRVTVKRLMANSSVAEFTAREFWKENYAVKGGKEKSVAPNAMWKKRVYGQLAKCAQAQALRLAFPEATGADATADEMEGKELHREIDVTPAREIPVLPECSAEKFSEKFGGWVDVIKSGRKSTEGLIEFVSTKYTLSADQKEQLREAGNAPVDDFVKAMEAAEATQ